MVFADHMFVVPMGDDDEDDYNNADNVLFPVPRRPQLTEVVGSLVSSVGS